MSPKESGPHDVAWEAAGPAALQFFKWAAMKRLGCALFRASVPQPWLTGW